MVPAEKGRNAAYMLIVFGGLAAAIALAILLFAVRDLINIAGKPEVPLSELKDYVGRNKSVRIRASALAVPPLSTPSGEVHAVEAIEISHEDNLSQNSRDVTDFSMIQPPMFAIGDGKNTVYADTTKSITTGMIHDRGRDELAAGGIGKRLAPLLCPAIQGAITKYFDGKHAIALDTIGKGDQVILVGKVVQIGGTLVMEPAGGDVLWVTTRSPDEALNAAKTGIGWSILAIVIGAVMGVFGLRMLRKKAQTPELTGVH